jgi:hypothetical protein
MTYYSKKDYKLIGYRKSKRKNAKYDAILEQKKTKKLKYVPFGAIGYSHFRDLTGLNLYQTHNDPNRRRLYRARHKKDLKTGYYSPGYFSYFVLW